MATDSYDPKFDAIVKAMCKLGATYREVADALGFSIVTLHKYRHCHPSFNRAFALGQDTANKRVEQSLYQRAVGYRRLSVKIFSYEGTAFEHEYEEDVAPDIRAQELWLRSRDADRWKGSSIPMDENGIPIGYNAVVRVIIDPQTGKPEKAE